MKIDSKLLLTAYVREMLGAPQIECEVTDVQISHIIDDAVQLFTEYAYGTLEASICIELKGKGEYQMPTNITNIVKLSRGNLGNIANFSNNYGINYVPDLWSQQFYSDNVTGSMSSNLICISNTRAVLEKYFGDGINYNFNPYKKVLQVFDVYKGPALLHFQYEYVADDHDLIYNHEWIKRYVIARTKILWGTITGKYTGNLVGGAAINYGDMKSEGNSELEVLNEELKNKYSDPPPVLIG
jgi:hypothetical protein